MDRISRANSRLLYEGAAIALGVALATVGLKGFLLPNGFLDGGVTGLAILIQHVSGWPVSITLPTLSIPFLALAYFTVSRRVFAKSVISILTFTAALEFTDSVAITGDSVLTAVFGGLCLGLGIGITIRNGAVLDGSEVLGIYLNNRLGISIGKVVLVFNVLLFSVTAFVEGIEVAMYSVLTFLVAAEVTDVVMRGLEDFIGLTIVSEHASELQQRIIDEVGAGLTMFEGYGGYGSRGTRQPQPIIQTVVNRIDVRRLYSLIDDVDPKAFVIEFDVHSVKGGVLRRFLK